jgi:hypothetical protein
VEPAKPDRDGYTALAAQGGPHIELADRIKHVLLRPDVTPGEVGDACAGAVATPPAGGGGDPVAVLRGVVAA